MKKWIEKYLSPDEIKKISEFVAKAESQTHGEIVPVIVKRSSTVGHVPLSLTLLLTVLFLLLEMPFQNLIPESYLFLMAPTAFVIFWVLSQFLAKLPALQKMLTPESDEMAQVWQRAELEFSRSKVSNTSQRDGIMLFVSVMERKAVILADEGISKHYPPETWKKLIDGFSQHLKKNEWAMGFEKAIEEMGKILAEKLPAQQHERNELANDLRILE